VYQNMEPLISADDAVWQSEPTWQEWERCEAALRGLLAKEGSKPVEHVMFCCMGRHGDIILASLYANQLIAKGLDLTWLTLPFYKELVSTVCPRCKIITVPVNPTDQWGETTTHDLSQSHKGYKYHVNAQPGAREHHGRLINSGVSRVDFVRQI